MQKDFKHVTQTLHAAQFFVTHTYQTFSVGSGKQIERGLQS